MALLGFAPALRGERGDALTFSIYSAGWCGARSTTVPVAGVWYHLVGTWSRDGMRLYINGKPAGVSIACRSGIPTHKNVLFGAGSWNSYLKGVIDEVRIYRGVLTDAEVKSHFDNREYVKTPSQAAAIPPKPPGRAAINVSDFYSPGSPTAGIQEALDSLPRRGGCVTAPPGTYVLKRGIHLRSNAMLRGSGPSTILKRPAQVRALLAKPVSAGDIELELAAPAPFEIGAEVAIMDREHNGWHVTHALVAGMRGATLVLDRPLITSYTPSKNAVVLNHFPILTAQAAANIQVEDLSIDGDLSSNPGPESDFTCAAIHLYNVSDSRIVRCSVHNFPSDGIGVQGGTADQIIGCLVENCRGHGFHPGTSLKNAVFRDNVARKNTGDGLYFCMEVEHSIFSGNIFYENKASGIGGLGDGRDRHNLITGNVCLRNGQHGINAFNGSDNSITNNLCKDNSQARPGQCSGIFLSDTTGTTVVGNRCVDSQPEGKRTQKWGIEEAGKSDDNLNTSNYCRPNLRGGITVSGAHSVRQANLE